ncbi:ATPase Cu transporting protein 7B, partial [Kickxella alabastrina]
MSSVNCKQTWSVVGMTCHSCVKSIEGVLSDLSGLISITVSLEANQATAHYSPHVLSAEQITEAIEDCGFDAAVLPGTLRHRTTMGVRGMTCQSCVRSIEDVLGDTNGVKSVSVSLDTESAVVEWDPLALSQPQVAQVIEDCGFDVAFTPAGDVLEKKKKDDEAFVVVGIEGMTCQSCVKSVTMALEGSPGVARAEVELTPRGLARVWFDPQVTTKDAVAMAIEDAGFDASLGPAASAGPDMAVFDGDNSKVAEQRVPLLTLHDSPLGGSITSGSTRTFAADSAPARKEAYSFSSAKSGETLLDGQANDGTTALQLEVHGMTCSSCVALIERALGKRQGITGISVSLLAQRATVHFDPAVVSDSSIVGWITELGFDAKVLDAEARVAKASLNVYGMT